MKQIRSEQIFCARFPGTGVFFSQIFYFSQKQNKKILYFTRAMGNLHIQFTPNPNFDLVLINFGTRHLIMEQSLWVFWVEHLKCYFFMSAFFFFINYSFSIIQTETHNNIETLKHENVNKISIQSRLTSSVRCRPRSLPPPTSCLCSTTEKNDRINNIYYNLLIFSSDASNNPLRRTEEPANNVPCEIIVFLYSVFFFCFWHCVSIK